MIEVKNLTKIFKDVRAVDSLNLTARAGEVTVLLGPNGAGKSTTIKCISGLLKYQGQISICGYDNKSAQAKRLFGYIPETPALYDLLTPWEHAQFIARAYRLPEGWEERTRKIFERLEIYDKKDKLARELSKGMTQKVSIAAALMIEPKAVIFDEPLVGLDPKAIDEVLCMFGELKAAGASVLVSTHIIDTIDEVWDRACILNNGNILSEVTRETLIGQSLKELFFSLTEGREEHAGGEKE